MRKPAVLLFLFALLAGCGDSRAPLDATVTGPEDGTFTIEQSGGVSHIVRALDFQVRSSKGFALPEVEIELFAGGNGILTDLDGNPLDPAKPTYFKTKTDDRGIARASFLIGLPKCGTADVTITGSVGADVGVTSDLWTATYTVKACS